MEKVIKFKNLRYGNTADYVYCGCCGKDMLLPVGTQHCPICKQTSLSWIDENNESMKSGTLKFFEQNLDIIEEDCTLLYKVKTIAKEFVKVRGEEIDDTRFFEKENENIDYYPRISNKLEEALLMPFSVMPEIYENIKKEGIIIEHHQNSGYLIKSIDSDITDFYEIIHPLYKDKYQTPLSKDEKIKYINGEIDAWRVKEYITITKETAVTENDFKGIKNITII